MKKEASYDRVVFYDGECGFCNSSVQFILNKKKTPFYFAALQSETGKKILKKHNIAVKLDTIYFLKQDKIYDRSSAALQIARGLKGGYPLLFVFYIIPKFLRDPFYNLIARYRHKIRSGYCMLPAKEDEQYFIKE